MFLATLHNSKVHKAQSLFLAVLAGQYPSLNDSRSSTVVSNVNQSLDSLAFFSVVRSLLTFRCFNLSDFEHQDSILDFSIRNADTNLEIPNKTYCLARLMYSELQSAIY